MRIAQLIIMLLVASHTLGSVWWTVSALEAFAHAEYNGTSADALEEVLPSAWGASAELARQPVHVQYLHAFLWGNAFVSTIITQVRGQTGHPPTPDS